MSIQSALQRVSAIDRTLADPAALIGGAISQAATGATGGVAAPPATTASAASAQTAAGASSFAAALQLASGSATGTVGLQSPSPMLATGLPPVAASGAYGTAGVSTYYGASTPGERIVAAAESQVGQTEQPPGSNESPAIAMYRSATSGAIPGAPWCAYFASWAARQAGEPIGAQGEGQGSVAGIWSWAQSVGRAVSNGPGVVPQPGDLIVFGDQHVGIVKEVLPNGNIETIEGNYENKVALNVRTPTEATGYVRMS